MRLKYARVTEVGPVRSSNEDYLDFWEPEDPIERRATGSIAILADGVGGLGRGEVASRTATETALEIFKTQAKDLAPSKLMRQMFDEANSKVFEATHASKDKSAMATTLVIAIFRDSTLTIGHIGDSRSYLVRAGKIKRLTTDHTYAGFQVRLGLQLERNAMTSPHRSTLTRSVGQEPFCHFDLTTETLEPGDIIVQCSDGLYGYVTDDELNDIVAGNHPYDACKKLQALAEKRQTDDNFSLQIIHVRELEQASISPLAAAARKTSLSGDVEIGTVLDGQFEITDLISRSGMAQIFRAIDLVTKNVVALKIPLMKFESDMAGFTRFEREEQIGTSLNHPCILKMYPARLAKSRPYLIMEYLEGQTLDELMQNMKPMPEPDAVKITSRICEALHYMHGQKVVHRDLKPQNIMICNDGSIRIMDFGIAKAAQSRRLTFVGFTPSMGTPDYMAPEQVKGKRGDERTDIYSLGAILYEMCTGSTPFEGESPYVIMNARVTGDPVAPRKLNHKLTPVIEEIILHSLERNPDQRYASAAAMKAELDDYEIVELTNRSHHLQAPQPWKGKFSMLPMILFFFLAQIIFAVLLFWFLGSRSNGKLRSAGPPPSTQTQAAPAGNAS